MGLTRQEKLAKEINAVRGLLIDAARASGCYDHCFKPMSYTRCPHCGKNHAPAAPMIKEEDWQKICAKLGTTGKGLVCLDCAEQGNGGHIALDQIAQVPFNVEYVLTELAMPIRGTAYEAEALNYFVRYVSRRINRTLPPGQKLSLFPVPLQSGSKNYK